MNERQGKSRYALQIRSPRSLAAALREAASRELTTPSEYARRALIAKLRNDGLDPAQFPSAPAPVAAA